MMDLQRDHLLEAARQVGGPWREHPYYDEVERYMDSLWESCIWPHIRQCDFSTVLDLATGHGRNAAPLSRLAGQLWLVDIHQENLDHCRQRFAGDDRFRYLLTNGISLEGVPDESISLVYCFDAMVHFDSDVVRAYLGEIRRVLRAGGHGFCHHSNYTANPTGSYLDNPGWRNFMSRDLFAHYCAKEKLHVLETEVMSWAAPDSDCVTLFRK